MMWTRKPSRMQTPRLHGYERRYTTFISLPASYTKVSKMRWKERPRALVSFAFEHPQTILIDFDLAPLSPEFLGVTSLEKSAILDVHTESTTVPPSSPNGHIPSSNQPTSRQQNDPVTPAVTTQNRSQTSISIPKGPVRPGPLSAPAVVSAPKAMYTPPIDDGHLPQHQYHAHRVPKRISTVPVITNGPHAQGHIMNYIHATTHQIPHQTSVNRVPPVPASQPPLPPQPTNHSVSSTNPTPQPVEGQRHSIGIPITCGDPIADNIFSGTSD